MNQFFGRFSKHRMVFCAAMLFLSASAIAQSPTEKSGGKSSGSPTEKTEEPPNAAQIELLETKYRFEANGDSRKEVHALVKINSELGVRQFARLNFDYNRSFQSVEIPLAHIAHTNGGTSDILPSAITDAPNPAVEKFPAYHDVRVKSVRILGLQPGDSLEYRVITTTTKPPLAPDFWFAHSFDRTGVVSRQTLTVELPGGSGYIHINPKTPARNITYPAHGPVYEWSWQQVPEPEMAVRGDHALPDVNASTFSTEHEFEGRLEEQFYHADSPNEVLVAKVHELQKEPQHNEGLIWDFYEFVARKIVSVDLPIGATGFKTRNPVEILRDGAGTAEDKARLLVALAATAGGAESFQPNVCLAFRHEPEPPFYALPTEIDSILLTEGGTSVVKQFWLDPLVEVAPFGMIPSIFRGKSALCLAHSGDDPVGMWRQIPDVLPFDGMQKVKVDSSLDKSGGLKAKVTYSLRGDNELLLRVTFRQTPPEKQKEIAQYLALSDGFRGKVTSVKTSDPYDTEKPFEVEYEITQEKFVDWSKKPVRIPALLPLPGLPESPKKLATGAKIELGPPLDVDLSGTLKLPAGTTAQAPTGTSVKRDYATFVSQYSAQQNVLHFSRHLNFISSQLPAERALDLNAFLHAVQNDQALLFELDKPASVPPAQPK